MIDLGKIYTLEVLELVPYGANLSTEDGGRVLLPNKFVPEGLVAGARIKVFLYTDSEDRIVATTQLPYGLVDEFVPLKAKEVTPVGAFMDWGLDKDLLVPFREQKRAIKTGETHVVRICYDQRSDRLIGTTKLQSFFRQDLSPLEINQPVSLMIYDSTPLGYMVVIDGVYQGMLYKTDVFEPLRSGETREGYIYQIREDGKIDVKLASFDNINIYKTKLMAELKLNGGFLPFHDKSDADTIQRVLKMSKKTFKKAVGVLLKEGKIALEENGIREK